MRALFLLLRFGLTASRMNSNVNAHLFNPSNITIGTGDVAFDLIFQGQKIGNAFIPGLVLVPGANVIATQVRYEPSGGAATAAGQLMLENFIQAVTSTTTITGGSDTTPIQSLRQSLASISLNTQIPPLMRQSTLSRAYYAALMSASTENLIRGASLVFPVDITTTGIANTNFVLANPFTASLNILSVNAAAIYPDGNLNLGVIDVRRITVFRRSRLTRSLEQVSRLDPPISAPGHSQITSYFIPMHFNMDPHVIIQLLETQATKNGVDLGPLLPLFAYVMSMTTDQIRSYPIKSTVLPGQLPNGDSPQCTGGGQFDAFDAILRSLVGISVTLQIQSTTKIDDYQTNLDFNQYNVPAQTDRSVLYLVGAVAAPIVQNIVAQSQLAVNAAEISDVTDRGFTAALQGSLTATGPFSEPRSSLLLSYQDSSPSAGPQMPTSNFRMVSMSPSWALRLRGSICRPSAHPLASASPIWCLQAHLQSRTNRPSLSQPFPHDR